MQNDFESSILANADMIASARRMQAVHLGRVLDRAMGKLRQVVARLSHGDSVGSPARLRLH